VIKRDCGLVKMNAHAVRPNVIIAIGTIMLHALVKRAYLFPAVSANQERREIGIWFVGKDAGSLVRLLHIVYGYACDEGQVAGQECAVEGGREPGVVADYEDVTRIATFGEE